MKVVILAGGKGSRLSEYTTSIPKPIFSSLIALIYSLPSLIKKTKSMTTQIPFGPYLIIGCVIYIVLVDQIFFYVLR